MHVVSTKITLKDLLVITSCAFSHFFLFYISPFTFLLHTPTLYAGLPGIVVVDVAWFSSVPERNSLCLSLCMKGQNGRPPFKEWFPLHIMAIEKLHACFLNCTAFMSTYTIYVYFYAHCINTH